MKHRKIVRKIVLLVFILGCILAPASAADNNTTNVTTTEEADLNNSLEFFEDIIVFVYIILVFAVIGGKTR